jgi:hypothetical protein
MEATMSTATRALLAILLCACTAAWAQDGLLLHYALNEGTGTVATDSSENKLNGTVGAAWADSPSGKALSMDGQSAHIVRVQVPMDLRFGKGSWTFSVWLKPTQFSIEDRQNQRRIFSFGVFPDGNMVIDLLSNGRMSYYFCYRNEAGTITSTGGSGATALKLGEWSYIALVCDREKRRVEVYLNGFSQGASDLPAAFDGDFTLDGELTFGSGWHNYWGLMDEVRVYRRALSRAEIKGEFAALKDTFGAIESPEAIAAEKREALMEAFAQTHELWAAGDFAGVRAASAAVAASPDCPAALRSYANLRIAQSFLAEGKPDLARAEYARIAATADYPEVHREEASRHVAELDRVAKGLPARDPAASRTVVPEITHFAAQVFVAPQGNDANSGTKTSPVATLGRARDLIRALKAQGITGAMAVNILPGEYPVADTFALTLQDSGAPDAPVVYRATEPGTAVFYGGARISGLDRKSTRLNSSHT